MVQRTSIIRPTGAGEIERGGASVASALEQMGYKADRAITEYQQRADTNYLMETFNDVTQTSQNIYLNNKDNPESFSKVFQSYQDELLEKVPARLKPRVKQELLNQRSQRYSATLSNYEKVRAQENEATAYRYNMNVQAEVYNNFRAGNLDRAMQLVGEAYEANLQSGAYTPIQVEDMQRKMLAGGLQQRILGESERILNDEGVEGLLEYRSQLQDVEQSKEIFSDPIQRDDAIRTVDQFISNEQSRLKRLEADRAAKLKATASFVGDKITDVSKAIKLGYEVDKELINELATSAQILELSDKQMHLNTALAMQEFSRQSPEARQSILTELLNQAPDKYAEFKSVDNQVSALERDDPLTHYERQGRIALNQIDYNDPMSLSERVQAAREVQEIAGKEVPVFTKIEQERLTRAFSEMPADQKLNVVSTIVDALGRDSIKTLNSLSQKNGAMLALGGQLVMDGAPDVAESVFMGQQVMTSMKEIMPKELDVNLRMQVELGNAYSHNPLQRETIQQAVKAVYADLSRNSGDLSGIIDSSRMKKATEMVTGGLIDYRSGRWSWGGETSKIEPPVRGMTRNQFEDWVDGLTEADIEAMGGASIKSKAVLEILKKQAELVSVRVEGKQGPVYVIKYGDDVIKSKDGGLFYLQYSSEGQ